MLRAGKYVSGAGRERWKGPCYRCVSVFQEGVAGGEDEHRGVTAAVRLGASLSPDPSSSSLGGGSFALRFPDLAEFPFVSSIQESYVQRQIKYWKRD